MPRWSNLCKRITGPARGMREYLRWFCPNGLVIKDSRSLASNNKRQSSFSTHCPYIPLLPVLFFSDGAAHCSTISRTTCWARYTSCARCRAMWGGCCGMCLLLLDNKRESPVPPRHKYLQSWHGGYLVYMDGAAPECPLNVYTRARYVGRTIAREFSHILTRPVVASVFVFVVPVICLNRAWKYH